MFLPGEYTAESNVIPTSKLIFTETKTRKKTEKMIGKGLKNQTSVNANKPNPVAAAIPRVTGKPSEASWTSSVTV